MRRRPRACNLNFSFMPNRLQFQPYIRPLMQQGLQWTWLSSSASSFQSQNSICELQPYSISLRGLAPAYLKYARRDRTAPFFVTERTSPTQPIVAIDRQKTSLDSGETYETKIKFLGNGEIKRTRNGKQNGPSPNRSSEMFQRSRAGKRDSCSSSSPGARKVQRKDGIPYPSQAKNGTTGNGTVSELDVKNSILAGTPLEKHEVMQLLRKGETVLTMHEFNDIVMALTRQKRFNEALSMATLTERKPLSDLLTISKSVKTYTILVDLYGRAQQLDRAISVFRSMVRKGVQPNVVTYNAMIAACSRNREADLANEVYEEMQENGLKPDKFTFGTLIDLCAKSGDIERAFDLSRQMSENGVHKDQTIYSALMEACGRAGQHNRAFQVFENMKRNGVWPNMVVFSVLIDICASAREPERAFNLFAEARHWGFRKPNVVVYTALIDACAKGGWPEKAELVFKSMIEEDVKPNHITFGTLIDGWARKGEFGKAFEVLRRMEVEHEVKPTPILVGGLIDACRRYRQCSQVKKLWDVIVRYNIKPSRLYYPGLVGMAVSAGELQIACAIVLHAYARGSLRRVSLNSEVLGLQAMACALIYLRHELKVNGGQTAQENRRIVERLHVVFGSVAMTSEQMDNISASKARDMCISWGDIENRDDGHSAHCQRPQPRGRKKVHRGGGR
ncbi:unnamed protein product [Agarophyton chilense]|eukprot:gb/GEZJ01004143.1/.p1 GENE.gb/GEZJ01004143.1/~~gb/GEZJ01004143.1/.p1  ORF type:complete len:676 (-),score=63.07 gb/GEZJ01004143.1/:3096-5123(-)